MWSYAFKRVLATLPTLLAVITVCYLLLHFTPGGPFDSERKVSAAVLANLQAKYHLDQPLWQQYLHYLNNLLHGDLGASFRYEDWTVNELVAKALPVSAAIGGGSLPVHRRGPGHAGGAAAKQPAGLRRDAAGLDRQRLSLLRHRPGADPGVCHLAALDSGRGLVERL